MMVDGLADARAGRCQISDLVWRLAGGFLPGVIHLVLQHESLRAAEIQDKLEMGATPLSQRLKTLGQTGLIVGRP